MRLGWYTENNSYSTLQEAWTALGIITSMSFHDASKYGIYAYDKQSAIRNSRNVSRGNIYHDGSRLFLGAIEIATWHVIPVKQAQGYVTVSQSRRRPKQTDAVKIWCIKPGEHVPLPKHAWAFKN